MTPRILVYGMVAALAGCAAPPPTQTAPQADVSPAKTLQVLKSSFRDKGQAKVDRLDQDETQQLCSQYDGKPLPDSVAKRIETLNQSSIKWPADGKYFGDWKNGEKIAQEGRGKQYSDDPKGPVGGNCYACHQLTPQEISYGTIGPSLYRFGKQRGYTDEMRRYAYGKVWNAEAYNACSLMPRFGHSGILTEQQVKDVVALLMDPQSPVNQ
ncbi:MAG TPA: sulfur oxidation c-type cytochrome SoxX [Casimicrobiaceae bacterium]|nr:sulfur oxidation c-type cytochrome SoxX [Casimicrobiaceae bacterium]